VTHHDLHIENRQKSYPLSDYGLLNNITFL